MQLMNAFQSAFKMEPDVGVRLIEQPQCVVANFLRDLGALTQCTAREHRPDPERPILEPPGL